jgi:hypothetical protein
MAFQKVEFEFPEGDEEDTLDIAPSSARALGSVDVEEDDVEEDDVEKDIEIEIVDDTPEADRRRRPSKPPEEVTDEELGEYSDKVRNRIKHFSKGYHDERRAKEAALRERQELESYARQLVDENNNLKGTVGKSQEVMLEQAKRSVVAELETAKKAYKEAYEAGDTDAVLEAQEALTTARFRSERINNYVPPLQNKQTPVKMYTEEVKPQEQRVTTDVQAVDWVADNEWFNSDGGMRAVALDYHHSLIEHGVDPQSKEYYGAIDARMRKIFPEYFEGAEPETKGRKRSANVVAPATRSVSPRKVKLTRSQITIAKRLGVPLELYAKQVAAQKRNA